MQILKEAQVLHFDVQQKHKLSRRNKHATAPLKYVIFRIVYTGSNSSQR